MSSLNITGQVLDAQSNTGAAGVLVEIFDKSMRFQSIMGTAKSDDHGRFNTVLALSNIGLETTPELTFKVSKEGKPFTSTNNSVMWNRQTEDDVTIIIRQEIRAERPQGRDRVSATQVFKAANFVNQSDFKGVYQQTKTKVAMPFGFLTDMLSNAFKSGDIAPVRVKPTTDTAAVYGQDVASATSNLQAQQVEVKDVLPYNPTLNSDSIKILTSAPIRVAPGQKVNLYQENGKVKYYTIVKDVSVAPSAFTPAADAPQGNLVTNAQFIKLNDELAVTRQEAVAKDAMITALKVQMETLQKDHLEMKNIINSDSFTKLIKAQNITGFQNPGA
jgi:5-hydroxyisourate hydrolase-like protein (transthyretin family)